MNDKGSIKEYWHLDKRVPISLIVTILIQTAVFGWLLSKFDSRLLSVERVSARLQVEAVTRQNLINDQRVDVAVINQNLLEIQRSLARIEKSVGN